MGRIPALVRIFTIALGTAALTPAAASAWMPEPVQFSRAVALPAAHAAGGAGGPVKTSMTTDRRFDMVGVEWRGARSAQVKLRVRLADGRWSRWADAGPGDDGPDAREAARATKRTEGQPIWAGGARRVQLSLPHPLRGLRLHLLNTTGTATAHDRAQTRAAVARKGAFGARKVPATNAAKPPIVSRAKWGAKRCKPRRQPSYGNVRVAYVHHTVSVNSYSRSQAASLVLGVCLYHRNSNGWDDIGYNFLVDRYGVVYEGRAGGVTAPVLGAQAGGFNSESTGVSMIGNFTSSAPPRAAMRSLAKLLAWKLSLHGVHATGHTKVTSAGGSSTGYAAGTKVRVNRISGHRDVDQTSCPGAALYRKLPALRRSVKKLEGAIGGLSIAPRDATFRSGDKVPLSGRLTVPAGAPAAGATIELRQLRGTHSERRLTTVTTADDGTWSADVPGLTANSVVRAVFAGGGDRPGVTSAPAYLSATPRISLTVAPTATAGDAVTATGSVKPGKAHVTVYAYRVAVDGKRTRIAAKRVATHSGRYKAKLTLKSAGSYRVVTRAPANSRSSAGRSRYATVTVTPAT
jgi:hypothetical protein